MIMLTPERSTMTSVFVVYTTQREASIQIES